MELWKQILEVLTPTILTIVGLLGTYLASQAGLWLKSKMKQSDLEMAFKIVDASVIAIEQMGWDKIGKEKYDLAMKMASDSLNQKKIKVTDEQLKMMIEASVAEFNKSIGRFEVNENAKLLAEDSKTLMTENSESIELEKKGE